MPLRSSYLTMRDGARVAIDVHVPDGATRVPAVVHQTRYFRRVAWGPVARALKLPELVDVSAETRKAFVAAGYAWIDVDVRGSGASTGSRPSPWWRDEIRDGAEVVDWIVRQPWSSGAVGSTGVSYAGTTSEFLLVNKHPAVKAIIPRFSLFDVFTDVAFPGGLHLAWFTGMWSRFNKLLDSNAFHRAIALMARVNMRALRDLGDPGADPWRRVAALLDGDGAEQLIGSAAGLVSRGVARTDDDPRGEQIAAAVADHAQNFDVHTGALQMTHRDDDGISPILPEETIDTFSPHRYLDDIRASGAAIYSYSGWLDGGYTHSAIKRHLNLPAGRSKLILGPWDHGGRQDVSPFAARRRTDFDHDAEMIRFFDHHLKGVDTGIMDEAPVRYFTMGAERWQTAAVWPPPHVATATWYFGRGGALTTGAPPEPASDPYQVDARVGTGARSRWRSLIGLAVPVGYGDRRAADRRLLCYTSAPLPDDMEVTGHPVVRLWVRSTASDGAFFVYLEDVAPDGRVTYVTEGQLRALHRALSQAPADYRSAVPHHSFRRADAAPLVPGEPAELVFDLQPTSYRFARGHAVRVAIAGADADHFRPVEGAEAPEFRVLTGGERPSRIELPVA